MFKESVIVTKSRNIEYFTSKWFVTHKSVRELYNKYTTSHPDLPVSLGSFLTLKPFYIRQTTTKDIEMCVCKSHLHARWSVKAVKWQSSRWSSYPSTTTIHSMNICQVIVLLMKTELHILTGPVHLQKIKCVIT